MKHLIVLFAAGVGIASVVSASSCIVSGSTARPLSGTTTATSATLLGALQAAVKSSSFGVLDGRLSRLAPGFMILVK